MSKSKKVSIKIEIGKNTIINCEGTTEDLIPVVSLFRTDLKTLEDKSIKENLTKNTDDSSAFIGIAEKDEENGELNMVATDLKARSAIDATERLIYVTLLAHKELMGEKKVERNFLKKILNNYGLYNANTRNLISKDTALIKEGRKKIYLSMPATEKAKKFIEDIKNSELKGSWIQGKRGKKKVTK